MSTKTKDKATEEVVVSTVEAEPIELSATSEVVAEPVAEEAKMVMAEPQVITGLDFGSDEEVDPTASRNVRFLTKKHKYFAEVDGIKLFFSPTYPKDETGAIKLNNGVAKVRGLQCGLVMNILGAEVMMDSIYIQRNDNGSFFWIMGDSKQKITSVIGEDTYEKEITNISATGNGDTAKYFQEARFQKLTPKSERYPEGGSVPVISVNLTAMAPQLWKIASSGASKPIV